MNKEYYFREGCFITELHNTPDDPAVSIARVRVESGKTTSWHALSGTTERYIILEGNGFAETGSVNGIDMKAGDSLIVQPGEKQRIKNTEDSDLIFYVICTPRFDEKNYIDLDSQET